VPRPPLVAIAVALLLSACLDVAPTATVLDFNFTQPGIADNWVAGVADVPEARLAEVNLAGDLRALPPAFSTGSSLYQAGTNVSGDLFVFQKKYLCCVHFGTDYRVSIQVAFVTDVHSGCTTGVGPAVVIKAGVSSDEPIAQADAQGVLRMNLDKGTGTAAGRFTQLGDIRNGLTGCPSPGTFSLNSTSFPQQSEIVHTDGLGAFWVFIGTQSSFPGRHEIYLINLRLRLEQQ